MIIDPIEFTSGERLIEIDRYGKLLTGCIEGICEAVTNDCLSSNYPSKILTRFEELRLPALPK